MDLVRSWREYSLTNHHLDWQKSHINICQSLQMDVTSRESITAVKQELYAKEGKLHILVNKYENSPCIHHDEAQG